MKLKEWTIWREGYSCTGNNSRAAYLGIIQADTFRNACLILAEKDEGFETDFDPDTLRFWGCQLYSTEKAARISFG